MPDKCLVLDETIIESCTAVPADEGEFYCPSDCLLSPI
jgi:hypothetical protein